MFHGKTSLRSVVLLLLVNFVSVVRLELMYIFLIVSIRASLTNLHLTNHYKRFHEAVKLACADETKESITC